MAKNKSENPLTANKDKAPKSVPKASGEEMGSVVPTQDTFGDGPEPEQAVLASEPSGVDTFDAAEMGDEQKEAPEAPKSVPAQSPAKVGDVSHLKTFTVEGEYLIADGKNTKVARYKELFVLSAQFGDAEARCLIKKLLLSARLKEEKEFYKRFRTYQITNSAPSTQQEVAQYALKHDTIGKMSLSELALYCAHHQLDVIPSKYSSVEEARIRVEDAKKSGKKVDHIPKDTPKKAVLKGQVDRTNKPMDDGLDG
jgi:hypothetical protein